MSLAVSSLRSALAALAIVLVCAAPAAAGITDLGVYGESVGDFNVTAVNSTETVVGAVIVSTDCAGATGHAARWTRAGGRVDIGVIGGFAKDISSSAWDINDAGLIVGSSHTASGCLTMHPFTSSNGAALVDLQVPAAADVGEGAALAVNAKNLVAGFSMKNHAGSGCNTDDSTFSFPNDYCPQVTSWPGAAAGSGAFGPMGGAEANEWVVRAVADNGAMVGYRYTAGTATGQYWRASGEQPQALSMLPREHGISPDGSLLVGASAGMPYAIPVVDFVPQPRVALALPEGATEGRAIAVNDRQQIVGEVTTPAGKRAVLWGGPTAAPVLLDTLLPEGSGWTLNYALDISSAGSIIGTGSKGGATRSYLLDGAIVVDNAGDEPNADPASGACSTSSGTCTLRAAIQAVNVRGGVQGISMRIPGAAAPTIAVASALPAITAKVTINGTTQTAGAAVIDGGGGAYDGLTLNGGDSELIGLVIQNFGGSGVVIGSSNNMIGSDTDGKPVTVARNGGHGIAVASGRRNVVGELVDLHANGAGGMSLGPLGAVNYPGGIGEGPNDLTSAPVIWQVPRKGGNGVVSGHMSGIPGRHYRITLSRNTCGSPIAGRPVTVAETVTSQMSSIGEASFESAPVNSKMYPGDTIEARATLLEGGFGSKPVHTSESSNCGWDRDEDQILDSWETDGADPYRAGKDLVDLPAMGASPTHRDLFLQVNWMAGRAISAAAIDQIEAAFAKAPVTNLDGTQGINLHIDGGRNTTANRATGKKWGALSDARVVPTMPRVGRDDGKAYDWAQFDQIKRGSFDRNRVPIFRFALSGVAIGGLPNVLGIARDIPSSDLMLGLKAVCPPGTDCVPTQTQQAATLMHELGHTLGMHHGGLDDVNNKPNYVSIMNYSFAFTGLVVSKNGKDRIPAQLDYSRWGTGTLGVLDEAFLNEKVGFGVRSESVKKYVTTYSCRKKGKVVTVSHWLRVRPVDFNCNGKANETSIASPINLSAPFVVGYEMRPHDNWGEIRMAAGAMVGKKDIFTTESPRSRVSRAMPRKRSKSVRTDAWPTRNQMLASARVLVNDAVAPKVTVKMKFIKARKRRPARVIITVRASDNRALDSVSLQVDKAPPVQLRAKARSRKLTKSYVLKLRKGRHTVRIVALDSIGNSSRVLKRTVKGPSR